MYLLKAKSDVFTVFHAFITMVETKFSKTIKYVMFDNAPELFFTNFYQSKGILSFHSCFETPQNNSVVERKDQHILNVARAIVGLLFAINSRPCLRWVSIDIKTVSIDA